MSNTAIDRNNLSPLGFQFKVAEAPNTEYQIQGCQFPGMNLGVASVGTGFVRIPTPGNLSYDSFSITFKVSESLKSYTEIFNWMVTLGHPDDLNQYRDRKSDCSLLILNSSKRPQVRVKFTDCFPVSLSPIDFDTTLEDVQFVTATASFAFLRMYFEDI